jgi:replicative DNA helicase
MSDRRFPSSIEYERTLLGGLMIDPSRLLEVADVVGADDFYRPDHRALFVLLRRMFDAGQPIDQVTVPEAIHRDRPDRYGGLPYVIELVDHVPATANLLHYAATVREKAVARKLIEVTQALTDRAFSGADVSALLTDATASFGRLGAQALKPATAWQTLGAAIGRQLEAFHARAARTSELTGQTTGFVALDGVLCGFQRGDLVIVAGRPGSGKSALALNMALAGAIDTGEPAAVFSIEMPAGQLVDRLLSAHTGIEGKALRTGRLTSHEWDCLLDAEDALASVPLLLDDTSTQTIAEVRRRALAVKEEHGAIGLVVVDYLQLLKSEDEGLNRSEQVSGFSAGLKRLARELDVPVVALAQLNRGVESRSDKHPVMSDLKDSGAIEADADVILGLYRDEYYNEHTTEPGIADVSILKHRNGATGVVKLGFEGRCSRFRDLGASVDI